jgi:hypothetical protein
VTTHEDRLSNREGAPAGVRGANVRSR